MDEKKNHACLRCGECCLRGGPALHQEDLHLLASGTLPRARIVTLRAGEPVHENVAGRIGRLDREIVKIAGSGEGFACVFHDATAASCLIHANRPAECRALFCRDTSAIEEMYRRERLTRADIVDVSGGLWELIAFHDRTFPAGEAVELARRGAAGQRVALEQLAEMAGTEESFRREFATRTGVDPGELNFYFGRPLRLVCAPFGVRF